MGRRSFNFIVLVSTLLHVSAGSLESVEVVGGGWSPAKGRMTLKSRTYLFPSQNCTHTGEKYTLSSLENFLPGYHEEGRSCENLSPVTFGFDTFSTCEILTKFSNCTQLRNEIEKNFDNLLQGESMASYSNLRPPFNATVPLLRNYPKSLNEVLTNSSHCNVPVLQDLLIQYLTLVTKNGVPIHRIIGVRVDRSYQNVTLTEDLSLTSRVLYFQVPSSVDKPMSRFWMKMFSPELWENSWLNIFKAFEDVNTAEREEITFWCIFLAVSVSTVVAFTKLDVNLGIEPNKLSIRPLNIFICSQVVLSILLFAGLYIIVFNIEKHEIW